MTSKSAVTTSTGLAAHTFANLLYLASGYLITVTLAHRFTPEHFGTWTVVMSLATLIQLLATRGIPVTGSAAIARMPGKTDAIHATILRGTLKVSFVVSAAAMAIAPLLAHLMGDRSLTTLFMIAALAALTYGFHSVFFVGLSGRGRHLQQAFAQASYAVVRLLLIVGGTALFSLKGAVAGFVAAPFVATPFAVARGPHAEESPGEAECPTARQLFQEGLPATLMAISLSLLLTIDLLTVKRLAPGEIGGAWAAAATIGHVPFFLVATTTFGMLADVASSAGPSRDVRSPACRDIVKLRLAQILSVLSMPILALSLFGGDLANLIFDDRYRAAATLVAPLTIATFAATIHAMFIAFDIGSGKTRAGLTISFAGVLGILIGVALLVTTSPTGAAWSVAFVALVQMLVHAAVVSKRLGRAPVSFGPWITHWILSLALLAVPLVMREQLEVDPIAVLAAVALASLSWLALLRSSRFKINV